jgi:hypothetical protein
MVDRRGKQMTRRIDQASARQTQPWREHGMSRATWFRQRARAGEAGKTAEPGETGKPAPDETKMLRQRETIKPDAHETIKPPETGPPLRLIESRRGPGRCAQCDDLRDGTETEHIINGARVLLHPECAPYYVKLHDEFHVRRWNPP